MFESIMARGGRMLLTLSVDVGAEIAIEIAGGGTFPDLPTTLALNVTPPAANVSTAVSDASSYVGACGTSPPRPPPFFKSAPRPRA